MLTITLSSPQLRPGVYKQMSRHTSPAPATIPTQQGQTGKYGWPSSFISTVGFIKFCEVLYLLNFREAPIDTLLAAEIITMNLLEPSQPQ